MGTTALIVDDSVIYRKTLARFLNKVDEISDVVQASNGKEGVRMYREKQIDFVTMDVEMPLMNGIEALTEILKINPHAKVLMISSVTTKGASYTLDALSIGAIDFITKEQAFGLHDDQAERLEGELLKKIQLILKTQLPPSADAKKKVYTSRSANPSEKKHLNQSPVNLLLVGSSTGGPPALTKLLHGMKLKRNYATVVVQHMPPVFTAQLAANLSKTCKKDVIEATDGLVLKKDQIVIAPGGVHLKLKKRGHEWICEMSDDEPVNSCKPSVDVTFNSVAKQITSKEVIAMILTGMGADGANGCQALHDKNIPILTQERSSCVVYGMPKAVDEKKITAVHATPPFLIAEAEKFMLHPNII